MIKERGSINQCMDLTYSHAKYLPQHFIKIDFAIIFRLIVIAWISYLANCGYLLGHSTNQGPFVWPTNAASLHQVHK